MNGAISLLTAEILMSLGGGVGVEESRLISKFKSSLDFPVSGGNLQRQNICLENKLSQALGQHGAKYDFGSFNKQGFMRTIWFLLDALG